MNKTFKKGGLNYVKKNYFAAFFGFMIVGSISGCSSSVESQIKKDYLKLMHSEGKTTMKIKDVKILKNYGNYNGSVVIQIDKGSYEMITELTVGEVEFIFVNTNIPLVWHNGIFYELMVAYENGLLTMENLECIKKINNNWNVHTFLDKIRIDTVFPVINR